MIFKNRAAAGKLLAAQLVEYKDKDAVVLALPRGGVVTGYEVASALKLPLEIVSVRKIGHPQSPELAIAAVDDQGKVLIRESEYKEIDPAWLETETGHELQEALRRSAVYREGRPPIDINGKIAILVDDGIATGLTMELAVESVKKQLPKKIIVAVPVAPRDAVDTLRRVVDDVIVLGSPDDFQGSVGIHYLDFPQLTDDEVIKCMRETRAR